MPVRNITGNTVIIECKCVYIVAGSEDAICVVPGI